MALSCSGEFSGRTRGQKRRWKTRKWQPLPWEEIYRGKKLNFSFEIFSFRLLYLTCDKCSSTRVLKKRKWRKELLPFLLEHVYRFSSRIIPFWKSNTPKAICNNHDNGWLPKLLREVRHIWARNSLSHSIWIREMARARDGGVLTILINQKKWTWNVWGEISIRDRDRVECAASITPWTWQLSAA